MIIIIAYYIIAYKLAELNSFSEQLEQENYSLFTIENRKCIL